MAETLLALIVFLFPFAYSPGPGNIFFAANGARFGFRATVPASAGYHLATWVVTAGLGLGLLTALHNAPGAFAALRIGGALYVLWLAGKLIRAGTTETAMDAKPASFLDGAALLLLNPKAYVIIALMFTQFPPEGGGDGLALVLAISTAFTLNNLAAFTLWTAAGDRLAACFARESSARALNTGMGIVLAAVAVWMLLT